MSGANESDTIPHQGGEKDGQEQVAVPPGRYLTGIRLILVCTRSVVLSFCTEPFKLHAHLQPSAGTKSMHLHLPSNGRNFHRQHLLAYHLDRLERL